MAWAAIGEAAVRAYGAPARGATEGLLDLCRLRGMPPPLAAPARLGGANVGLVALRLVTAGETVLEIPEALWRPHSAEQALAAALKSAPALHARLAHLDERIAAQRAEGRGEGRRLAPLAALAMQVT